MTRRPQPRFHAIPTNLIMGFLGAGKTTAILELLKRKDDNERWAVLVNEFGAVGIDGAIFSASRAIVKEVPGGCLCCVVGVPLQVAVNRLLRDAEPDRLLIEPSGLGHPKRVVETLSKGSFGEVLELRAAICLVDSRKLKDPRYATAENFIDQIALADVLVANKLDLAVPSDVQAFDALAGRCNPPKQLVATTVNGVLDRAWLDLARNPQRKALFPRAHDHRGFEAGQPGMQNSGDGYRSRGWVFPAGTRFDHQRLSDWFSRVSPERGKGIFETEKGWFLFNSSDGMTTVSRIAPAEESRAEMILPQAEWEAMERALMESEVSPFLEIQVAL